MNDGIEPRHFKLGQGFYTYIQLRDFNFFFFSEKLRDFLSGENYILLLSAFFVLTFVIGHIAFPCLQQMLYCYVTCMFVTSPECRFSLTPFQTIHKFSYHPNVDYCPVGVFLNMSLIMFLQTT